MASTLKKIVADFRTSLSSKIAVGGTSGTIQSATDDDSVALPAGKYFFTVDGDNSQKEHITCDLSSTNLTNIKSVSRQGTETSGTVREHRVGATVTITDFAHIKRLNDLLNGTDELDSAAPLKYDADPTFTDDQSLITKKYADDLAILGSPLASDSVQGISKLSVAAASALDPIAVGTNDGRVPTQDENNALVGTSGTPSTTNKFVTNDDTATAATASKVARRLASGDVTVNTTPTNATDAASKAYVDGNPITSKTGLATYDVSTASGTQNIAHGLGRIPKITEITTLMGYPVNTPSLSWGNYDGTTQNYLHLLSVPSVPASTVIESSNAGIARASDDATNYAWASATVDATNIILAWTKVNSPTGTLNIMFKVS